MGIAANFQALGHAFRIWTLARALDKGKGWVTPLELSETLKRLRVRPRSAKRWTHQALCSGLVWDWKGRYHYASLERASHLLGVDPGRAAVIPVGVLTRKGWKSWLWLAFLAGNIRPDRPISRSTLRKITGVPATTQRVWERSLPKDKLIKIQHYGFMEVINPAAMAAHFRDTQDHPGAFLMNGTQVGWPLPNTYQVKLFTAPWGRSRKISVDPVVSGVTGKSRLFFRDQAAVDKHLRKLGHLDCSTPAEIYSHAKGIRWEATPLYDR